MKILSGIVTSIKMKDTALVEIVNRVPHPLYKKLLRRSKKYKADTKEVMPKLGDSVEIEQTKPISKEKFFKVKRILTKTEGGKNK